MTELTGKWRVRRRQRRFGRSPCRQPGGSGEVRGGAKERGRGGGLYRRCLGAKRARDAANLVRAGDGVAVVSCVDFG